MTPTIDTVVSLKLEASLKFFPDRLRAWLVRKTKSIAISLASYVKTSKLSGQVIQVRSGKLRRGVFFQVIEKPDQIIGQVGVRGVPYARILEKGGQTKPHMIRPKTADGVLAFEIRGKPVFAKYVMHPGSKFPPRSYLGSALKDYEHIIRSEFAEVPKLAAKEAGLRK